MKRLLLSLPLLVSCGGEPDDGAVTVLNPPPGCIVTAAPCAVTAVDGLRVELQLPPAPEPLKPFQARVNVTGKPISSPVLELSMIGMDMGDNRYRLVADKDGSWTATVVLPVCTLGRADWVADVIFSADGTRYRARFPFSTGG